MHALVHDVLFGAVKAPEEIEMPPGAAELAVGDGVKSDFLLLPDDVVDLAVFDLFSCAALSPPLACFARASWTALGRSRLPTWSARNGGLVRFIS
jgi:hypothetical protein